MPQINALVIAVLATALMTAPSVAQTYGDHPHIGDWGWGGTIFGLIMSIVFFAVAAAAVVPLVRWLVGRGHGGALHGPPGNTPQDILKERFAKGEIDKEEFEERRRVLGD
jgi:putative membrane protein